MVRKQPQTENINDEMPQNTVAILGVRISSTKPVEVLKKIEDFVANSSLSLKMVIFTPNPEFLVEASKNKEFKEILNKADINIPDGIGLVWASRFLGQPINERVSGADLVERLLEVGNEQGWTIGISGARSGGISKFKVQSSKFKVETQNSKFYEDEREILLKKLTEKFPKVSFVNFDTKPLTTNTYHLFLACQGMVKQETWILENKDKINARVFMGVGSSLDFLTGFARRAPIWMREIGLEWLWRGLQRPGHWRRIWKATVVFGWRVLREKIRNSKH